MGLSDDIKKEQVANMTMAAGPFAAAFRENNSAWGKAFKDAVASFIPDTPKAAWDSWVNKVVSEGYIDKDTGALLKEVSKLDFPLRHLAYIIAPLSIIFKTMAAGTDIAALDIQYDALAKTTPHPAPVDALVSSMILDPARASENRAQLRRHGFDDTQIDNIILSHYARTDLDTIRNLFLRKAIDSTKMYERLRELGFTDARIGEIIKTWELIPPVQDLITMSVREVFSPDIAEKFGQFQGYPKEFGEWCAKQGLSEQWARNYWAAHWHLPSAEMGMEMLHRGVIDSATLDLLLKALDVMPYWRDKIKAISYHPYTRVDVRRMHELGVIDDAGLIRAYMDLGYDKEKALKMAEFTIKYNDDTGRQLTRETILSTYREDLIGRTEAKTLLLSQDYSDDLAEFYLTAEDFKRDKEILDLQLATIEGEYLSGIADEPVTRSRLSKLGLRGDKINALMDQYVLKKYNYVALPSRSDIDELYLNGKINQDQWRQVMKRHGFVDEHIFWLLSLIEPLKIFGGRSPSRSDLDEWFKKGAITKGEWENYYKALGYGTNMIANYSKVI